MSYEEEALHLIENNQYVACLKENDCIISFISLDSKLEELYVLNKTFVLKVNEPTGLEAYYSIDNKNPYFNLLYEIFYTKMLDKVDEELMKLYKLHDIATCKLITCNAINKLMELKDTIHIIDVTNEYIEFDDKSKITYYHDKDCCETNYADFKQIEPIAFNYRFKKPILFELDGSGFRFGNENKMVFIPCYSIQNGYYSNELDILYNDKTVIQNMKCKIGRK